MTDLKFLPLILAAALAGCNSPVPNMAFVAPDEKHWVAMEKVAPAPDSDELLPTLRLSLMGKFSRGPLLVEGVETLCGTHFLWQDNERLLIRIGADRAQHLRFRGGESWGGITMLVELHHEMISFDAWSRDQERRLLVISECESENWNLYLRRVGEPPFNAAMQRGWDDPDLFGGFESSQPPLSLKWTGPRSAVIRVPGKAHGVTLREKIGDVHVRWQFIETHRGTQRGFKTLAPAH